MNALVYLQSYLDYYQKDHLEGFRKLDLLNARTSLDLCSVID